MRFNSQNPYFLFFPLTPYIENKDFESILRGTSLHTQRTVYDSPQCVADFFHVKLDELKMSTPFHTVVIKTREKWVKNREAIRGYCQSLDIHYFESENEEE